MSEVLLYVAVTSIVKSALENGLARYQISSWIGGEVTVSALPLDRVDVGNDERPHINLFLYQVSPRGLFAGSGYDDAPEASGRPRSVDLHYVITAYGGQDLHVELLLCYIAELLQETAVIDADGIRTRIAALAGDSGLSPPAVEALKRSGLDGRISELRINPQVTGIQELQSLWSMTQTPYRPSHLYRASVMLKSGPDETQ